jgi:methyl-accepting chemotaxis protein
MKLLYLNFNNNYCYPAMPGNTPLWKKRREEMKIKFKLSLLVIIIMTIAIAGVAVILLRHASNISVDLSIRNLKNTARQQAHFWKGREDGYLQMLHGLANVMGEYESMPAQQRRDRYDEMLKATLINNSNFVRVFSVWKPNALDGMDTSFIGRPGSTATGQYAMTWGRDTGQIIPTPNLIVDEITEWLNGPNAKKDRVEDLTPFNVEGKDTFIIRLGVPITNPHTNEVVGNITCLIDILQMQNVLEKSLASLDEIYAISIYSNNGTILASYMPDRVGKKLMDSDLQYGQYKKQANQAIRDGKEFYCESYTPLLKETLHMVMTPFEIGNSGQTWTIMMGSADSFVMKNVREITEFTIILAVIAITSAAVIMYFVLSGITKPITLVANVFKNVAKGDLTQKINVHTKDEIGDLAHDFNSTLDTIKDMIGGIKKQTTTLSKMDNDLTGNMTETASAMNQITTNIQNIKERVNKTNSTMEQVVSNINKLHDHVENQSDNISHASSAIEEMVTNISSVTKTLGQASEMGLSGLQELAANIHEIARESENLIKIKFLMKNIESQTNMLSMNAAIVTAHAGDSGKGFAIVADGIRKFAESSTEESKAISGVLRNIFESINKMTKSMEHVLKEFKAVDSSVKTVVEQKDNIPNMMEEQGEGGKQVLKGVSNVNEITRQVIGGSEEMLDESKEVINESHTLEIVTREITGGMNEMVSGADQVNVAVHHVNDICAKNRESIALLMEEVSRFKVA